MLAAACAGALVARLTIRHCAAAQVDRNSLRGMENLLGSGRKRVRTFPLLRRARLSQRRARGWQTGAPVSGQRSQLLPAWPKQLLRWLLKLAVRPASARLKRAIGPAV